MSIKFSCPGCGHHLKAHGEQAARKCKCPHCNQVVTVPVASTASPAPWRRWLRRTLGAVAVVAVLAGGLLLAVFLYGRAHEVDQKLSDLGGEVPEARTQALLWLAQADPQDAHRAQVTAALEPLIFEGDVRGNLDPDLLLRAYLHWVNQDNVPSLIRMVENHSIPCWSEKKTGQVMAALGKLQDPRAADVLAQKLADPHLHDQAVDALRQMGPGGEDAVLGYLFDGDPDTQKRAGELLAAYGTRPKVVFDEAWHRLLSNDPETRLAAAAWFADNPPDDDLTKSNIARGLAGLLSDQSPEANGVALRALKLWATKDCSPSVVAFAERQTKAVGKHAAENNALLIDVLAQFPDESAAEAIALRLKDPGQRVMASQALLKLGPVATGPVLHYLNHPDADVRKEARALCGKLKVSAERQLEQTLADVADAHKARSRTALEHLAQLRPDEASRVKVSQALNAPLLDPDPGIREGALSAIRVWATCDNTATLLKLLGNLCAAGNEDGARTVERVGQTLISIGPGVEEAVIPLLKSPEVSVRGEACRILSEVGTDRSVLPLQDAGQAFATVDVAYFRFTQMAIAKIATRK